MGRKRKTPIPKPGSAAPLVAEGGAEIATEAVGDLSADEANAVALQLGRTATKLKRVLEESQDAHLWLVERRLLREVQALLLLAWPYLINLPLMGEGVVRMRLSGLIKAQRKQLAPQPAPVVDVEPFPLPDPNAPLTPAEEALLADGALTALIHKWQCAALGPDMAAVARRALLARDPARPLPPAARG